MTTILIIEAVVGMAAGAGAVVLFGPHRYAAVGFFVLGVALTAMGLIVIFGVGA